jgi:hypothetical protein
VENLRAILPHLKFPLKNLGAKCEIVVLGKTVDSGDGKHMLRRIRRTPILGRVSQKSGGENGVCTPSKPRVSY